MHTPAVHDTPDGRPALARLPDVIVVGPPRTGTTWLDAALREHVGLPQDVKETQFFKWNYEKGIDWYTWHFRNCRPGLPVMEICPSYFNFDAARERIKEHIPNCKIICILRDPVERLYSVYRHYSGFSGFRSFEEMVKEVPDLVEASDYALFIPRWQQSFGKTNVLILFYEDLERAPQEFLDSICRFVGIGDIDLATTSVGSSRVNASPRMPRNRKLGIVGGRVRGWLQSHRLHKAVNLWQKSTLWNIFFDGGEKFGPPSAELEQRLRQHFRPSVEALEKLVNRELPAWKSTPKTQEDSRFSEWQVSPISH
jgi:hypothetical protein